MAADGERHDNITQLPPTSASADRSPSTDAHTRDRWAWLDQVLADRELTHLAFAVAYVIASHVNRDTGEAWPSQARIAEMVGSTERGARKTIEQLVDRGHVIVTTPNGRKGVNRYRLTMRKQAEVVALHRNDGSGKAGFHRNGGSRESTDHRNGGSHELASHRNGGSGKAGFHRNETADFIGTVVPPNPMKEPSEGIIVDPKPEKPAGSAAEPKAKPRKTRIKSDDPGFIEAYELYPRHDAPDAAKRAYAAAIGRGAKAEEILAGVRRYAAQQAGRDPQFTAMMSTWLNAGRWKDGRPLKGSGEAVVPTGSTVFRVRGQPIPEANIIDTVRAWRGGAPWHTPWGAPPDDPACPIPREILERAEASR